MKILVTGGAGFIGSHINKLLLDAGHQVVVVDNLSKGHQELVDTRAEFIKADINDGEAMVSALQGVDWVIHLAGFIEVPLSVKDPLTFAQNNVMGSIALFESMVKAGVKKIVFSSTAVVYGAPKTLPLTENMPLSSTNPYGASKIADEQFLSSYHTLHGFDVVILRYFNPYGPNEMHQPETHAIPNFIKSALGNTDLPVYWGGEQVRDFIYVEDLAKAHTEVLNLTGFNVFNVGCEQGVKVIDVINLVGKILGKDLQIKDLGERPGDVTANYASSKKLTETTGWSAKIGLEEGLKKTIEWFKTVDKN
ncbi:MAG: UDP-glucose 4-epimerase GalE [Candidatus Daviesbacteria bacterium]|nr:UDP-glucose 4-epimerase GalE [Candidatus Daviesbacteria bacterium]